MKDFQQVFFSNSSRMNRLKALIDEIAKTDIAVLIKGENGTGKELVAHTIHLNSPRRVKPFIKVNCATIPRGLLESELFGFEKGAFTGAHLTKPGKFELANEGTILLNNIEEVDFSVQAKLLQVLQDGEFSRLGGGRNIFVNTRVVTTSKDHLEKSMLEGHFREDLFYRINVMSITVPPLRDRREQILPLSHYFFDFYKMKYGKNILALSSKTINAFHEYHWPGNVRELENVIKRVVLFGEEELNTQGPIRNEFRMGIGSDPFEDCSPAVSEKAMAAINLKEVGKKAAEVVEREVIQNTLLETHWHRKEAAKLLCVSYKALLYKIQKYHLNKLKRLPVDEEKTG